MNQEFKESLSALQLRTHRLGSTQIPAAMLIASILLPLLVSEEALRNSRFVSSAVLLVGKLVPGVMIFPHFSHYPVYTAVLFAMNWILVPVLVALALHARRPTNSVLMAQFAQNRAKHSFLVRCIIAPGFVALIVAMDLGLIPGIGFYSGHGASFLYRYSALARIDRSPLGIAFFSWMICVGMSAFYSLTLFVLWRGLINLKKVFRRSSTS